MRETHPFWRLRAWLLVKLAGKRQVLINARIGTQGCVLYLNNHDLVVGVAVDWRELSKATASVRVPRL